MWKFLMPAALAVVLVIFFAVGLTRDPYELPSALQDKPAPTFDLPALADPTQRWNNADLLGKVSLVNAWGSWCTTCLQEHEHLITLARDHKLPIYGLNYRDDRKRALNWLERLGNPYAKNGFDESGQTAIEWGVAKAPESFVIDKRGYVRMKLTGAITPEVMNEKLLPLLAQLRAEPAL